MDSDSDAPPVPSSGPQDEPSTSAKKRFRDAAKSPQLRKKNIVSAGTSAKQPQKAATARQKNSCSRDRLIFFFGGLTAIILIGVVLVIVFGLEKLPDYEVVQSQFNGEVQFEELDGEFVKWSSDMNSVYSGNSQKLISSVEPKIISAFLEEGVVVDAIVFNKLTPSEPKIVRRNEKITSGRAVVEGRTEEVAYVEKTYLGVQTITADYETLAKPSDNAAVFGSIQPNQWPKVAQSLSSRMASKGVKASMKKMRANPNFEKAVALQIEEAPETVTKPEPVKLKTVKCTCELNGHFEEASSYVCDCSSSCLIRKGNVFGGRNDIFGVLSNLCKSAYYADVMDEHGGKFEVIKIGKLDRILGGSVKYGIVPRTAIWRELAYKVKTIGPIVKPTLPPLNTTTPAPTGSAPTSAGGGGSTSGEGGGSTSGGGGSTSGEGGGSSSGGGGSTSGEGGGSSSGGGNSTSGEGGGSTSGGGNSTSGTAGGGGSTSGGGGSSSGGGGGSTSGEGDTNYAEAGMFVIFIRLEDIKFPGASESSFPERIWWKGDYLRDPDHAKSRKLAKPFEDLMLDAVTKSGFRVDEVKITEYFEPVQAGLCMSFRMFGDFQANVVIARNMESGSRGSVSALIFKTLDLNPRTSELLGFRYTTQFLNML